MLQIHSILKTKKAFEEEMREVTHLQKYGDASLKMA